MANWATEAEALALTGQTVTDAQLTAAQGIIDIFSGTTIEAQAQHTVRDLRLLRMATAYQAVWQAAQVDVTSRTDVKRIQQDAMDVEPAGPESLLLAPLAQRCIVRLSWMRARSVRVNPGGEARYANVEAARAAWMRDGAGDARDWVPL